MTQDPPKLLGILQGVGSQGCDLILLGMELENELTDPWLELSLKLVDFLHGLLEIVSRQAQLVLR